MKRFFLLIKINSNLLSLFKNSYLYSRFQYVQIDGDKSARSTITCYVPRGFIPGLLLFILLIDDFNSFTKKLKNIDFAYDSALYAKDESPPFLAAKINTELHNTLNFLGILADNKLNFASHMRDVCTKVSRGIVVCNRLTPIMNFVVMRKLFFIIVYQFLT